MNVGITGHQDLGDLNTINWLNIELGKSLKKLVVKEAYSSLAIGADQLFANLILRLNISLVVIIPCKKYDQTFDKDGLSQYENLVSKSNRQIELPFDEPSEKAFYEAGKKVVDFSDILFAIWNNKPGKGFGGTADIVKYAQTTNRKIIHLNPILKTNKILNYGK